MKGHVNLYATVGRAPRQCVGTFDVNADVPRSVAESSADHAQAQHLAARVAEGHAANRVKYEREFVEHAAVAAVKGKR